MKQASPIPGYYQVGYVTNDFERALRQFGETHGIRNFLERRDACFPTSEDRSAHCHIALAYVGSTEIEVIHPVDGDVGIYREYLPKDEFVVRFHHISRLHDTEQAIAEEFERVKTAGIDIPINGRETDFGSWYFYADYREQLGHFLENIHLPPAARKWLTEIPRN